MPTDLPPRKTLVMLFRSLQYAQSDLERREIVRAARVVREDLELAGSVEGEEVLSPLARRIVTKCGGQTLSFKSIAHICGKSPQGSTIRAALRELLDNKLVTPSGKGVYAVQLGDNLAELGDKLAKSAVK